MRYVDADYIALPVARFEQIRETQRRAAMTRAGFDYPMQEIMQQTLFAKIISR